jgi:hypothetical protein
MTQFLAKIDVGSLCVKLIYQKSGESDAEFTARVNKWVEDEGISIPETTIKMIPLPDDPMESVEALRGTH